LHSSWTGDAATRGGLTSREGTISSPASAASSTSAPTGCAVTLTAWRRSYVAMLQTNSPVSRALLALCLLRLAENMT
jgi:hypothetical protein